MSDASSSNSEPQSDQYTHLKRPASRWQLLPSNKGGKHANVIKDTTGARDILLYLKNVPDTETGLQNQIKGALKQLDKIGYNYERATGGKVRKRRLQGNKSAHDHMGEYTELIRLARTMWPEPSKLGNPLDARIDGFLTQEPGVPRQPLENIFEQARFAAETRLRFINDIMRHHPVKGDRARWGASWTKRLRTNNVIHNANVVWDANSAAIGEGPNGMGWSTEERNFFTDVYEFSIAQAQLLANCVNNTSTLPQSLHAVFRSCAGFTDAYVDWTGAVTEVARNHTMTHPTIRNLTYGNRAVESKIKTDNQTVLAEMRDSYSAFRNQAMPAMVALVEDVNSIRALREVNWNSLITGMDATINAINACSLTRRYIGTAQPMISRLSTERTKLVKPTGAHLIRVGTNRGA
ncbi:hypothetical protein F5Y18DRAFT_114856 [Xylariaceae sp. FL1019]|nr:hypothetical protein F5Y18DRAFT_114856 [Xylariaceae sp. FL1019]